MRAGFATFWLWLFLASLGAMASTPTRQQRYRDREECLRLIHQLEAPGDSSPTAREKKSRDWQQLGRLLGRLGLQKIKMPLALEPIPWSSLRGTQLAEALSRYDPEFLDPRRTLLEGQEVLSVEPGGLGVTMVVADRQSGKLYRYKAPQPAPSLLAKFTREAEMAVRAGQGKDIAPRAEWDESTRLLKMEEVPGKNLERFILEEFPALPRQQRARWITNFSSGMRSRLKRLHKLGIAHLDVSPRNIMVPTENADGRKSLLVDFGLAMPIEKLPELHAELDGNPYSGTPRYQGFFSREGLPAPDDDFAGLRTILGDVRSTNAILNEMEDRAGQQPVAVPEIPSIHTLRVMQKFQRTPAYPATTEFYVRSRQVSDLFSDWLGREEKNQSFASLLEQMHAVYRPDLTEAPYRPTALANRRGRLSRDYISKYFGLDTYSNGVVSLPGIPVFVSPRFDPGAVYTYSGLSHASRYYESALNAQLTQYSKLVAELGTLQDAEGRKSRRYQQKERAIFDTIVDFGRIAAAYRPFKQGNWGLFGPIIGVLVNRIGYRMEYPGFLDIIFQGATPEGLKPWFARMMRQHGKFYSDDGFDPVRARRGQPTAAKPEIPEDDDSE